VVAFLKTDEQADVLLGVLEMRPAGTAEEEIASSKQCYARWPKDRP